MQRQLNKRTLYLWQEELFGSNADHCAQLINWFAGKPTFRQVVIEFLSYNRSIDDMHITWLGEQMRQAETSGIDMNYTAIKQFANSLLGAHEAHLVLKHNLFLHAMTA